MAMSAKSKNASASDERRHVGRHKRIDRPFDAGILKRAREIVDRYQVVMRQEDDGYYGRGLELTNALGDGTTPQACLKSTRESMTAVVAFMLERGEQPPAPASDEIKLVQLNVRISAGEKLMFEEAARQRGQGLSEFIRSAALERAKC